jgi:2,5-diamino-6-(ribosylamino)-4(3H)-pyrimidinone 5'-phosphate reductase
VIILLSEQTPETYLDYLKERQYDFYVAGPDHVDLRKALQLLSEVCNAGTVVTDAGRILGNLLLNQGLADEVSLLVHPLIVGKTAYTMFGDIDRNIFLKLIKKDHLEDNYLWLTYRVIYD